MRLQHTKDSSVLTHHTLCALCVGVLLLVCAVTAQEVETGCEGEADIVFAIDASRYTREDRFEESRDFIRSVILRLQVRSEQTRVGIISLGDEENYYTMQLGQFTDRVLMVNYVDREVQYRGGNIDYEQFLNFTQNEAFLQSVGGRDVVPNVLVLIISDVAMYESRNYRSRIERLRESGVNVISYVYGDDVSESRLSDPMRRWSPEPRARFLTARARDLRMEQLSMESRDTEGRSTFMTTLCQEVPSCAGAADITFVLDSSGSVGFDNWQTVQDFCTSIVNEMNIGEDGVRIAAISFSTTSSVEFDLTRYHTKYQLDQALHELSFFEGYTNTSGALRTMRTRVYTRAAGDRLSRQDIAIVISDGASTEEKGQLAAEAREVHNYGIFTFAIAINIGRNNPAFLDEMHTIASDDNSVFELGSFTSLEQIENRLVSRTCRPVAPVCNRNLDVIFMLDASGSISRDDFLRIINFVRELASRLDIDGGAARVGMLTFATVPEVVFHLRDYDTISEVTRAMQGVEFTRGLTHTHTALSFVLETMFSEEYGSRPDVDRVLLVVTDGDSSDPVQTIDMCRQIRSEGIDILTVGIGDDWVSVPELQAMSSFPKNRNSFVVEEYEDLFEISDHMLRTICDLVDECESDPCANAGQCQDGINSYYCECRSGFTGRDCSESCPNVADVVFLLDSSGSIERESFNVMQEFIRDVLFGLNVDVGTRVGVLQFSTSTDVVFHLNEYSTTRDVLQALNLRYTGGRTNTAEAIRVARTSMFTEANGDREGIPNIIILLTDGKSNEREATLAEALEARKDGIHISVIGVGQSVGQGELENIATDPDDRNLYMVRDFNALRSILDNLLVGVCNSEDECEDDPCDQGECVDGINTYTCACEPGFTGRHCDRSCSTAADIAFMIDASGSIQRDNFERVLHFAKNLVLQMAAEGNPDQIHLSVGSFADQPSINLRFDEYSEPEDVFHALDSLTFDGGETNVHLALQLIKTQMFDIQRGDRPNVPNYVILLTDGVPNLDRELTVPSAIELHIAGIHVILVLIGPGLNSGWNYLRMHAIASEPYEQNIFFGDFNTIFDLIPDVADALCNEADECESDPCQNGGQCQDGLYQYRCQCSERFTGVNCERRCSTQLDIIFLVDISGSIEGNYDKEVSFMKRIVSGLNYAFRRTRTGMIKFAGTAEIGFTLDAYDSSQDVLNALPISDIGINTNIAAGLNLVIEEGFVLRNGDRPGIDNVLITLTDGKANIQVERVEDELDDLQCAGPTNLRRFTIGIGESVNRQMIERLSCRPTNSYAYYIPTRNDVDTVADRVLQELCT